MNSQIILVCIIFLSYHFQYVDISVMNSQLTELYTCLCTCKKNIFFLGARRIKFIVNTYPINLHKSIMHYLGMFIFVWNSSLAVTFHLLLLDDYHCVGVLVTKVEHFQSRIRNIPIRFSCHCLDSNQICLKGWHTHLY